MAAQASSDTSPVDILLSGMVPSSTSKASIMMASIALIACFIILPLTERAIEKGATSDHHGARAVRLTIPDKRFGYTASDIHSMLKRWGPGGAKAYLWLEAIDLFVYIPAYATLGHALGEWAATTVSDAAPSCRGYSTLVARLPYVVGAVDVLEDVAQIAMVLMYDDGKAKGFFPAMVRLASGFNRCKWVVLGAVCVLMSAEVIKALIIQRRRRMKSS